MHGNALLPACTRAQTTWLHTQCTVLLLACIPAQTTWLHTHYNHLCVALRHRPPTVIYTSEEAENNALISGLTNCFVELGLDEGPNEVKLKIYKEQFETEFLKETRAYYQRESARALEVGAGADDRTVVARYASQAAHWLDYEKRRSHACK